MKLASSIKLNEMNYRLLILSFTAIVFFASCSPKEAKPQTEYAKIPNSILIVYSSGTPSKTLSDMKADEIEGVTGPTPTDMNVAIIAQNLSKKLADKNYTIRIAKSSEIASYKEILQYDMLIMGTPTYFWNIHWEMKKFMDECFEKIYVAHRDEFKKMKHITFAMSEYGKCAENANRQMEWGITDCSAKVDTSLVFIAKQTMPQYDAQITQFAALTDNIIKAK